MDLRGKKIIPFMNNLFTPQIYGVGNVLCELGKVHRQHRQGRVPDVPSIPRVRDAPGAAGLEEMSA